jgi:hypothetical protein
MLSSNKEIITIMDKLTYTGSFSDLKKHGFHHTRKNGDWYELQLDGYSTSMWIKRRGKHVWMEGLRDSAMVVDFYQANREELTKEAWFVIFFNRNTKELLVKSAEWDMEYELDRERRKADREAGWSRTEIHVADMEKFVKMLKVLKVC